jgi:hypothetical protein
MVPAQAAAMKLPLVQTEANRRQRAEALLEARVREVFRLTPFLLGFSVGSDLSIEDLELHTWPGCAPSDELYDAIQDAVREVAEESDEAAALLRGRTFARTLQ